MFKTFLLLFGLIVFFTLIGRLIAGKKGMIIAFVIALVLNGASFWYSDTIVLKMYNAQPVSENHRLYRITKELTERANMPMPRVYIIQKASPNAFATGRSPEHGAVAATAGILRILTNNELRGVIAHELGHIKNRDTLISTVSASIAGAVMILSRAALFFGGGRNKKSFITRLAVAIIAPVAATIITMAISREREYKADKFAADLTGQPKYLASSLVKLTRSVQIIPMRKGRPETAHMFIVHPFSGKGVSELFSTHPPVKKRINILMKMQENY